MKRADFVPELCLRTQLLRLYMANMCPKCITKRGKVVVMTTRQEWQESQGRNGRKIRQGAPGKVKDEKEIREGY